jgi:TonB family protein
MSDVWRQFEGQIVDEEFPLKQLLAGDDHSAVFLTQRGDSQPQNAVIKLVPADPATTDLQLSRWRLAAQLSHPNLLKIFDFGRGRLEDTNFLYVVLEFAEEDLSQILPQRALTGAETRDMLGPVLDVLVYLHAKGLVHGHIKPSNIQATADQLKLSSDTLASIAESQAPMTRPSLYTAPEVAVSGLTAASDVWSLGVTLVEVLTRRLPVLPADAKADPVAPDTIPQPFLDIARHALVREPKRRWTIAEIAARMNPTAVAAAAGQSISPLAVPLSSVPAVPAAKLQSPKYDAPAPKAHIPRAPGTTSAKQTLVLPNYAIPVFAVLLVLVAIIALPKILGHRAESSTSAANSAAQPAARPKPVEQPAHRETSSATQLTAKNSAKAATEKKSAPPEKLVAAPAQPVNAAPATAALRTDTFPSANAPKSPSASAAHGEVLDQVLPEVSGKARGTIQGKVRVSVRVHVEPAGNVSQAELDAPGPSRYFADLAIQAARRWEFTAPEVDGHSVPSEWVIRFEFTQADTKAFPTQKTP